MTTRLQPSTSNGSSMQMTTEQQQLISDLKRLSEDPENADVLFLCGREEERVTAHRIILMARCQSFKNSKNSELCRTAIATAALYLQPQIRLPYVRVEVMRQFILFLYTAKLVLQDSRVFELLDLAQDMGVEDLRAACEDYIISALCQDKSVAKHNNGFIERCIIYIGENASQCVKRNSFLKLTKDALIKLISSDYFCLEEEDVWRCVLAWAKKQAGVTQTTQQWTEEERTRVCQHLAGVIGHVRILLIDSQVFAEEVEPTGAVPIELSLERYRHAALNANHKTASNCSSMPNVNLSNVPALPARNMELKQDKRLQPRLMLNMFPESQIFKKETLHLQGVLNKWYGVPKQVWRLIYRASAHAFTSSSFHKYCDGIAPCFVIGLGTKGEISGGFTDVPWIKTNSRSGYIPSEHAFLFRLNPAGNSVPMKFDVVKKLYAICYHQDYGPIFGAGADLLLTNNCNENEDSYSNLPHSYDGPNASCNQLFGDYNFAINDYEVYTPTTSNSQNDIRFNNMQTLSNHNDALSKPHSTNNETGHNLAANKYL